MRIRKAIPAIVAALLGLAAPAASNAWADEVETAGVFHGVGVIVEIAPERPAVTLNHEDIKGLMPGMEMMFNVESKSLLSGLKVGDRVDFDIQAKGFVIVGLRRAAN